MSNYPFTFSVVVYHGHDQETGESIYHRQQGMGFADSFSHAAGIIENYYGSELINIQKLELFEESDLILMPQSCIDEYKRREFSAEADGYACCIRCVPPTIDGGSVDGGDCCGLAAAEYHRATA